MYDFTITIYKNLLSALINKGYSFQTYAGFLKNPLQKVIILRHDVDLLPENSLVFAKIQHESGIKGSYYFRAVTESWNEGIIREIASLGHEIGYHYECLTTTSGNREKAIDDFNTNLDKLRQLAIVETICMHGSPRSKFDSKDLWKTFSYRDYGIIGEPYFDTDFSNVLYLTDTGRRWDGNKVSVRDRVQSVNPQFQSLCFHQTSEIITATRGDLPDKIMFTFHPQRWTNKPLSWMKELIMQNIKNVIKRYFLVK